MIALLLLAAFAFGLAMLFVGIEVGRRLETFDHPVEWTSPPRSHVRIVPSRYRLDLYDQDDDHPAEQ